MSTLPQCRVDAPRNCILGLCCCAAEAEMPNLRYATSQLLRLLTALCVRPPLFRTPADVPAQTAQAEKGPSQPWLLLHGRRLASDL